MSRVPSLSSPFLLGFDEIERVLDRVAKGADGYPPYNIERLARDGQNPERLRITLAVAGFTRDQLDVCVEESQLVIRGRQQDDKSRQYLHRGIAARQFQRTFVLADGMEVQGADLKNGLLLIDQQQPVLQVGALHLHAVRQHEGALELARGDAAVEILPALVVLLSSADHQLTFLDADVELIAGEAGDGKRDTEPLRILPIAGQPFDVVRRVAVGPFGDAVEHALDLVEAQQERAG